jgi:small-conductance mechanosensitive channel
VILALVIGWSVRDLFADLVAGGVLAAARRVKRGVWVSGEGFQGTVEGRSLRATWLRDAKGGRLTVPNRAMVGAPMVFDAGADAEHEVEVRLEGYEDAGKVRMALTDAILSSPWVLAGATPVVLRDPADPVVWRVRTKLLEPRFSVHFEGELLERVEDLLRYEPVPDDERETLPGELPLEG